MLTLSTARILQLPFHPTTTSLTHPGPVQGAKPAQSPPVFMPQKVFDVYFPAPAHSRISTRDELETSSLVSLTILSNSSPLIRIKNMIKSHSQLPNTTVACREQQWMPGKNQRAGRRRNMQSGMTVRIHVRHKILLIVGNV